MKNFQAFGETKSLPEWARDRRCSVPFFTLRQRIEEGWELERALQTPSIKNLQRLDKGIDAFGTTKSLVDWAADERAKAPATTILWRIRRGWSAEKAITTPAAAVIPKHTDRALPELYAAFGTTNTLRGWLEDPRCLVRREKLVRNLKKGVSMEQALVHNQREHSERLRSEPDDAEPILTTSDALEILSKGGEVWQVNRAEETRISILRGNVRYSLEDQTLNDLLSKQFLNLVFNTESIHQYAISEIGRQAAV